MKWEGSKGRRCGKGVKEDDVGRALRKTVWVGSKGRLFGKGIKEDYVGRE